VRERRIVRKDDPALGLAIAASDCNHLSGGMKAKAAPFGAPTCRFAATATAIVAAMALVSSTTAGC
jgi:hypothetical protein